MLLKTIEKSFLGIILGSNRILPRFKNNVCCLTSFFKLIFDPDLTKQVGWEKFSQHIY